MSFHARRAFPSGRRHALKSLAVALGLTLTLQAGVADAAASAFSTARSGLPWASGMSCWNRSSSPMAKVEAWRGHKFDVVLGWAPHKNWGEFVRYWQGGSFAAFARQPARIVIRTPLLTNDHKGDFNSCAKGAFDAYFRQAAQAVRAKGRKDTVFALGWEANGSWFPWSIGNNPEGYKGCFRRAAKTIRSVIPGATIEWPMAEKGHLRYSVEKTWPGDAYVDVVGLSFYDRFPSFKSEALWNASYLKTHNGGPNGLGQWLRFAKRHHAKLSLGEWGISDGKGGSDNPLFIKKTTDFFARNAKSIAYETYYNCGGGAYQVYPEKFNPKAGATYRKIYQGFKGKSRKHRRH